MDNNNQPAVELHEKTLSFSIKLNDFNVEKAIIEIAKHLIKQKPYLKRIEYAKELGVSERTFYRLVTRYGLVLKHRRCLKEPKNLDKLIARLNNAGYEVRKKEEQST